MSLINQMLRDLDSRGAAGDGAVVAMPSTVVRDKTGSGRAAWKWILLVIIVLSLLFLLWFSTQKYVLRNRLETLFSGLAAEQVPVVIVPAEQTAQRVVAVETETPQSSPEGTQEAHSLSGETASVDRSQPVVPTESKPLESTSAIPIVGTELSAESVTVRMEGHAEAEQLPPAHVEGTITPSETRASADGKGAQHQGKPVLQVDGPLPEAYSSANPEMDSRHEKAVEPSPVVRPEAETAIRVTRVSRESMQQSAGVAYVAAREAFNKGRLGEAAEGLRHALALDQSQHEARHLLSMLLWQQGERKAAVDLLQQGLQSAPDYAPFAVLRGRMLIEEGDISTALRLLEQYRRLAGEAPELLLLLGSVYQQAKKFPEAAGVYRQLVTRQPANARALAGLAISLDAQGKFDQALIRYRAALAVGGLPAAVSEYAGQRVSALTSER